MQTDQSSPLENVLEKKIILSTYLFNCKKYCPGNQKVLRKNYIKAGLVWLI